MGLSDGAGRMDSCGGVGWGVETFGPERGPGLKTLYEKGNFPDAVGNPKQFYKKIQGRTIANHFKSINWPGSRKIIRTQ